MARLCMYGVISKFSQLYQELPVEIFQDNWKFPSRKLLLHHPVVKVCGSLLSHLVLRQSIVSNQLIIFYMKITTSEVSGTSRELNLHKLQWIVRTCTQFWHLKEYQVSVAQRTTLFSVNIGCFKNNYLGQCYCNIHLKNGSSTEKKKCN